MGIDIRSLLDTDPKTMLGMSPCMDLDRFVLHHVLEAPAEFAVRLSPTMKFADCHAIMVKLAMEGCVMSVSLGEANYAAAQHAGQIIRKTSLPAWCVSFAQHRGFGRNFEEALCKFALCRHFDIK